jgi:hypothetical protein
LNIHPDSPCDRPWPALLTGDLDRGAVLVREAFDRYPDDSIIITVQGLVHAFRGEREPALDVVRRACEMPRFCLHPHPTDYQIAGIYSLLGGARPAMDWLARSVNPGFPCGPFFPIERL